MRRAALALALAALALSRLRDEPGKEREARKVAKAKASLVRAQSIPLAQRVARASSRVRVAAAVVVRTPEATAAVVTLHNGSATAVRDVPIEIDVRGAGGATLYTNAAQGLSPALVTVSLLAAHSSVEWIDDQIPAASAARAVTAKVGEGMSLPCHPGIAVTGRHRERSTTSGAEVEGDAVNHSAAEQHELVVDCVAMRGGRVVAAGRAVCPRHALGARPTSNCSSSATRRERGCS